MSVEHRNSRGHFLRSSASAPGAMLAAPSLVPSSAVSRSGLIPPSERIIMGFGGVGGQGGGHRLGGAWTCLTGGYAARKDAQAEGLEFDATALE